MEFGLWEPTRSSTIVKVDLVRDDPHVIMKRETLGQYFHNCVCGLEEYQLGFQNHLRMKTLLSCPDLLTHVEKRVRCFWVTWLTVITYTAYRKKSGVQLGFEPRTFWILVRCSYHWAAGILGRGVEDRLHKQHCLEASAEFQLIFTLSELDCTGIWTLQPLKAQSRYIVLLAVLHP